MAMFVIAYKLFINVFSPSIYVQILKAHLQKMATNLSTISLWQQTAFPIKYSSIGRVPLYTWVVDIMGWMSNCLSEDDS